MTCPECGGAMEIDHCCVIEEQTWRHPNRADRNLGMAPRRRLAAAALCTRCECCIELTREQLRGLES